MNGITLDMTPDEFKQMLWETLNEKRSISDQEHTDHHATFAKILPHLEGLAEIMPCLKEFIDERRNRKKMWNKFRLSLIGAVAVAIVGFLTLPLTWIGALIVEYISRILRH